MNIQTEYARNLKLYCPKCGLIKIIPKITYKLKGFKHDCVKDRVIEQSIKDLKQGESIEIDLTPTDKTQTIDGIKMDIVPTYTQEDFERDKEKLFEPTEQLEPIKNKRGRKPKNSNK